LQRNRLRKKVKEFVGSTGFIVVVAFAVRMAVLFYFQRNRHVDVVVRDSLFGAETGAVAAAIARGEGFSSPLRFVHTGPTAWFTPIYPYLLAGIFKLFGVYTYRSEMVAYTTNMVFSALTVWPIAALGNKVFGKRVGAAAPWVWVFLPASVYYSVTWAWDTSLAALWMALLFAETLQIRGSDRMLAWLWYGALWAVGAMINPTLISVLPFLALWAVWPLVRQELARAATLAVAASMVFLAGVAPWTIRNYAVFHKFIPFRSNFGLELWLGNSPDVPAGWAPFLHPNDNMFEATKYARMTEIPYMEEKQREAVAFMRAHPGTSLDFTFRRFVDNWIGVSDPPVDLWARAPLYYKSFIVLNCVISLLSWCGALFASRTRNDAALPFASVMLFFPAIFYVSHTSLRYRLPMDGIMLVLAVYAIAYPLSFLFRRSSPLPNAQPATYTAD
jgi:dolichyl-phosphate-mannose-protein mannosyltransferase